MFYHAVYHRNKETNNMSRINLEQIAAEFGLVVEKSDVGTYKQWKDVQLDLYLPRNKEAGYLVRGVYPPVENYAHYPSIDNLYLPVGVTRYTGKPEFSGRQQIYNDDFNEGSLREKIGKLLDEYRRNHDGKIQKNY